MINAQLSPPSGFQASLQATGSSISSINTACQNVNNMPVYSSPFAPSLPQDIANAKIIAGQWTSNLLPEVTASLQGIVSFNGLFQGEFDALNSIAQQIASGDTSQITVFQGYLKTLQQATSGEQTQVNQVQTALTQYLVLVDNMMQPLNSDCTALQNAVNSLGSQMQNLEQQMAKTQKKIDEEKSNPFSKIWDELTGQLQSLENQQRSLQGQTTATILQLSDAQNALSVATNYQNSFGQISGGVNGLADGWESLDADLQETLSDENITDYNAFTPALVQAASADWLQAANLAQSFL